MCVWWGGGGGGEQARQREGEGAEGAGINNNWQKHIHIKHQFAIAITRFAAVCLLAFK